MKMTFAARGIALLAVAFLGCDGAENEAPPQVSTQKKKLEAKTLESLGSACQSAQQPRLIVAPSEDAPEPAVHLEGKELNCGETYELVVSRPDGTSTSESLTADTQGKVQSTQLLPGQSGEHRARLYDSSGEEVAQTLSHNSTFRSGHLTWRTVGPRKAEFSVVNMFRRAYPGSGPDGLAITGDTFQETLGSTSLCFGDGLCTGVLSYRVTSYNAAQGWLIAEAFNPGLPQTLPGTGVTVVESEPNNTLGTANSMQPGDDYSSTISVSGDSDYVRFTLSQRTRIELRTVLQGLGDSYLYLYSATGGLLASDDDGGGGLSSLISTTLDAGTYYIRAAAYSSGTGRQLVQFRQVGTLPPGPHTRTYSTDGPFTASLSGCCREGTVNTSGYSYLLRTVVRFNLSNSSPVSTLPFIVDAPANTPGFSFQIPATDAEGDTLTFRLATYSESYIETLPSGLTVSSTGLVSWSTMGTTVGQLRGAQVIIEERRNGVLIGSSAVDFLLRIISASGTAPTCLPPAQTSYSVSAGQPVQFTVGTRDPDANDTLTLSASGVPTGALLQPALPLQGLSGISSTFSWTPTTTAAGLTYPVSFTVTDPTGQAGQCTVRISVLSPPANRAPVANAGPDQSISPGATATLNGGGSSDPDGHAITYRWSIISSTGPAVTLSSTTSATPSFTTSAEGVYTFLLTVTDSLGATGSDTIVVRVANLPPVANAGPDQSVSEGATVTLSGSGSDPEGSAVTYVWSIMSSTGSAVTLSSTTSLNPSFSTTDNGSYTLLLTATDSLGAVGTDTVIVRVNNVAPQVSATGGQLDEGQVFTSAGSFTDPGADSWSATVDYGDGTGVQPLELGDGSFTLSHRYTDNSYGDFFTVEVVITDDDGARSTTQVPVQVRNVSPVIVSAPSSLVTQQGQPTAASVTFTDPGEDSWLAWVDYGDGTTEELRLRNRQLAFEHTYSMPGTYVIAITLQDDDGGSTTVAIPVEVHNVAPVVYLSGATVPEGRSDYYLSGYFDDPSGTADTFTITVDYGDGTGVHPVENWGNRFWVSPPYPDSGTYLVTVTVTDSFGGVGTTTAPVVIINVEPYMTAYGRSGPEGSTDIGVSGHFSDPGAEDAWTITVDYGDGTPVHTQQLTSYFFELFHTYAHDGEYTVRVTLTDNDGGWAHDEISLTVYNVWPELSLPESGEVVEGSIFHASGSFSDPGADTWTAMVNYGDESGWQPLPLNGKTFELEHVYANSNYWEHRVSVSIQDNDGGSDWHEFTVTVHNVAPEVSLTGGESLEGSPLVFSGSFIDPGAGLPWSVWIDYGDWDSDSLEANGKSFTFEHTYQRSGVYTATVYVYDGREVGMATVQVVVHDVPPVVTAQGGLLDEGSFFESLASFSDVGQEVGWTVFIDYGDGSYVETFSLGEQEFGLFHHYLDSGTYQVTISVMSYEEGGGVGTITVPVVVRNVAPSMEDFGGYSLHEGSAYNGSGSIHDPGDDTFTITVDYGDGSAPQEILSAGGYYPQNFELSHVYDDNGLYTMTFTIVDEDGGASTHTEQVWILNEAPTAEALNDSPAYWGMPVSLVGTATDPSQTDTLAGFTALWSLGNGTTGSGLNLAHAYSAPGTYWALLTVTDKDGGSNTVPAATAVMIQQRPGAVTCQDTTAVFGFPAALSAHFVDGLAGGLPGGRSLRFRLGDSTGLGSATTSASGLASVQSPGELAPGTYSLTVSFAGDSHYTAAEASCTLTVTRSNGKITGGGLRFPNSSRGGFNVMLAEGGSLQGELQFQNATTSFHAHELTALGLSADKRQGWLAGLGRDGRAFTAYLEDNGEPGSADVFKLWIDGTLQTGEGAMSGGNIQIH